MDIQSEVFNQAISAALLTLLTAITAALVAGIRRGAAWLEAQAQDVRVRNALRVFGDLADAAVSNVEATVKPVLKSVGTDGMTPELASQLRKAAIEAVLTTASAPNKALVREAVVGSEAALNEWVGGQVELALERLKASKSGRLAFVHNNGVAAPALHIADAR